MGVTSKEVSLQATAVASTTVNTESDGDDSVDDERCRLAILFGALDVCLKLLSMKKKLGTIPRVKQSVESYAKRSINAGDITRLCHIFPEALEFHCAAGRTAFVSRRVQSDWFKKTPKQRADEFKRRVETFKLHKVATRSNASLETGAAYASRSNSKRPPLPHKAVAAARTEESAAASDLNGGENNDAGNVRVGLRGLPAHLITEFALEVPRCANESTTPKR